MWAPLNFILSKLGDLIMLIFAKDSSAKSGIKSIATPRAMPKEKAEVLLTPIVKHIQEEVQDQLSVLLEGACDVYYYQFKACAHEWA